MIYCKISTYQLNSYLSAAMGVSWSSDNHHRWFLGALPNCDFRWESILEEFGISFSSVEGNQLIVLQSFKMLLKRATNICLQRMEIEQTQDV